MFWADAEGLAKIVEGLRNQQARLGPDFRVFVGLEEFTFPMMALGAQGTMNAVANVAPRQVAQMCDAVRAGDLARGRALHFELYELMAAVFWDTNPIPIKYMLRKLGVVATNEHRLPMKRMGLIANNEHRLPMMPATPELERRLDGLLERVGLLAS